MIALADECEFCMERNRSLDSGEMHNRIENQQTLSLALQTCSSVGRHTPDPSASPWTYILIRSVACTKLDNTFALDEPMEKVMHNVNKKNNTNDNRTYKKLPMLEYGRYTVNPNYCEPTPAAISNIHRLQTAPSFRAKLYVSSLNFIMFDRKLVMHNATHFFLSSLSLRRSPLFSDLTAYVFSRQGTKLQQPDINNGHL